MNVTTRDIRRYLDDQVRYYNNRNNLIKSKELLLSNINLEKEVIKNKSSMCPPKSSIDYREHVPSEIDGNKVVSDTNKQFYNFEVAKATSCAVGGIFYVLPCSEGTSLTLNEMVNEYITDPRRIGTESAYGYAILGGIKGSEGILVAKTPSRGGGGVDLIHELFVALNGTNKLRPSLPNLSVVFAGFNCSKAIINPETKKVVQWCSPSMKGQVPYTVYENISRSISAFDYTRTATVVQVFSMLYQVLLTLEIASKAIGFTHYDLHNENLLMNRDVSQTGVQGFFVIEYDMDDSKKYVLCDRVATFIDYGRSTIT